MSQGAILTILLEWLAAALVGSFLLGLGLGIAIGLWGLA